MIKVKEDCDTIMACDTIVGNLYRDEDEELFLRVDISHGLVSEKTKGMILFLRVRDACIILEGEETLLAPSIMTVEIYNE